MVDELNESGTIQNPPIETVVTPPVETPPAESVAPDPVAEAKAAVEAARAESVSAQAERDAARVERDAVKAEAEMMRRSLANPVPAAPVAAAPAEITDEQKAALEAKHGKSYDQIVADAELTQRIVSRGTAPLLREQKIEAMRARHGALFANHEKAFREQIAALSLDVEMTDRVADGILRYVVGDAVVGTGATNPAAAAPARPAGTGRQIVSGTGLEGAQGGSGVVDSASSVKLSDEQKYVARQLGLSEAAYAASLKKSRPVEAR